MLVLVLALMLSPSCVQEREPFGGLVQDGLQRLRVVGEAAQEKPRDGVVQPADQARAGAAAVNDPAVFLAGQGAQVRVQSRR